jgi:hypothetical protein
MLWSAYGSYKVQNNTIIGYGQLAIQEECDYGSDNCSTATTALQNNVILGYSTTSGFNGGQNMSSLCTLNIPGRNNCDGTLSNYPANQGWTTRGYNLYAGMNHCPLSLVTGETCNTLSPGFTVQPSSPIVYTLAWEQALDPINFPSSYNGTYLTGTAQGNYPASGSSAISAAGTPISGLTLDSIGYTYNPTHPSIGNLQFQSGVVSSPTSLKGVILKGAKIP